MLWVDGERAARHFLGTPIVVVLLESERIHCKHAGIAGHPAPPFAQDPGDAIPHRPPPAEAEVERVRGHDGENVARPIANDGPVTFESESRIVLEPGTGGGCVTTGGAEPVRARRLDRGNALGKGGSRRGRVSAHDQDSVKTVSGQALRIVGQQLLNVSQWIATMGEQELESVLTLRQRIPIGFDTCGICRLRSQRCFHDALLPKRHIE
ncbi:MAG TPA: hypothetical protein VGF60_05470 [Xanthobacteraceae bacterium]